MNPGLKAIWEEERQRRRENNDSSIIELPQSQGIHNMCNIYVC